MPGKPARVFSREFKEGAVLRIMAGERVRAVAAELQIWPKLLYDWWRLYDRGGATALRSTGRPRRGEEAVIEPTRPLPLKAARKRRRGPPGGVEAEAAAKRIAELERKVGEQGLEIDFFRRALRHTKARTAPERRAWRLGIFALIHALMPPQGRLPIDRMCALAGRQPAPATTAHWRDTGPREEETTLRDTLQRLALARSLLRVPAADRGGAPRGLGRESQARPAADADRQPLGAAPPRVRARRRPTPRHTWRVVPNLARGWHRADRRRSALGRGHHLSSGCSTSSRSWPSSSMRSAGASSAGPLRRHLRGEPGRRGAADGAGGAPPGPGTLIHHSDRGVQYACAEYSGLLAAQDIQPSMSRVGVAVRQREGGELHEDAEAGGGRRAPLPRRRRCAHAQSARSSRRSTIATASTRRSGISARWSSRRPGGRQPCHSPRRWPRWLASVTSFSVSL